MSILGARDSAMGTSFYSAGDSHSAQDEGGSGEPMMALCSDRAVDIKVLSWMDRVKSQHLKRLRGTD